MKIKTWNAEAADAGLRVDRFLAVKLDGETSRTEILTQIKSEGVLVNDRKTRDGNTRIKTGDRVCFQMASIESKRFKPEKQKLVVVYEDRELLILDKKAGQVVHPAPGHREGTIVHGLAGRKGALSDIGGTDRPGIVHRLDKDTSGLLIIAKNNRVHARLTNMFKSRQIHKRYRALVLGRILHEEGEVHRPIGRHPKNRLLMAVVEKGRDASTRYRVIERYKHATLLDVFPETGRTHQIRVHLASMGHPVIGDKMYGHPNDKESRLCLHAAGLEFAHPKTGKPVRVESEIPKAMAELLKRWKTSA